MPLLDECARHCPHCGEPIRLLVDLSGGTQSYVEDCAVCCQPILINLWVDADLEGYQLDLRREEDPL